MPRFRGVLVCLLPFMAFSLIKIRNTSTPPLSLRACFYFPAFVVIYVALNAGRLNFFPIPGKRFLREWEPPACVPRGKLPPPHRNDKEIKKIEAGAFCEKRDTNIYIQKNSARE